MLQLLQQMVQTFNVGQDGEDNNIDYDIESSDEFVINQTRLVMIIILI